MKRVFWVLGVCLGMLALLWTVRGFDASAQPSDEILAYEIDPGRSLTVSVPGGVERVYVTTWLLVGVGSSDELFSYGIKLDVVDFGREHVLSRTFETRSRLSDVMADTDVPAARLADASAWVCEPRTFELSLEALRGGSGQLRVGKLPAGQEGAPVLLRLTYDSKRGELERRLLERTLSPEQVRSIMARRSSLGFFDIPQDTRMDALMYWERRLTALGREGRDYVTRRLLLGDAPARFVREPWRDTAESFGPTRRLALTLDGAASLRVHAEPGTELLVRDGVEQTSSAHVVGTEGNVELELGDEGLRSLEIYPTKDSAMALDTSLTSPWVTSVDLLERSGRYELHPDVRRHTFYRLDPDEPVEVGLIEGQTLLGASVRAMVGEGDASLTVARVRAAFRDRDGKLLSEAELEVLGEPAEFEWLPGEIWEGRVSEAEALRLRPPYGAVSVQFFGSPRTLLQPFVTEPGVDVPVHLPPYDRPAPDGFAWRNAPWDTGPRAAIHPDNRAQLEARGRRLLVSAQVRLEPVEGRGTAIAPRVLEPLGAAQHRYLMALAEPGDGRAPPDEAWVLVQSNASAKVKVDQPLELRWMYLTKDSALGKRFALVVDGVPGPEQAVAVTSGSGSIELSPGAHEVGIAGLPAGSILALRAKPGRAARWAKRQRVYAMPTRKAVSIPFARRPGERLSLVLLAGCDEERTLSFRYRIDGGAPRTHQAFFRRATEPEGVFGLRTGDHGRGLVWQPRNQNLAPDTERMGRAILPLGDDLSLGQHQVSLMLEGSGCSRGPVWYRAVLVGRVEDDQ